MIFSQNLYISASADGIMTNGSINFPFSNIKAAFNTLNASYGSINLILFEGLYAGVNNANLNILNNEMNIRSLNDASKTIIDCNGSSVAFYASSATLNIENITFINCSQGQNGGAISILNGVSTLKNVVILNSHAINGGAVACVSSVCTIDSCIFMYNGANNGGAIYSFSSMLTIGSNTVIQNNFANIQGGGVYSENKSPTFSGQNISINDNRLSSNTHSDLSCAHSTITFDIALFQYPVFGVQCS